MARLTVEQWEQARAEYEIRGISLQEVGDRFGVDRAAVSRKAKKEGWIQGKNHGVVEKKVAAIKALADANAECHALPVTFQTTIDVVVRERLQAEGMIARLDFAIAQRGIEMARMAGRPEELEILSRASRNIRPQVHPQGATTTVNVTQSQRQSVPCSPYEAVAEIIQQADAYGPDANTKTVTKTADA